MDAAGVSCPASWRDYGLIVVGSIGVGIAWGQWVTARSKLILDLYEKRREVYSKFHGPIGQAVREGQCDTANYIEYLRTVDQAKFLFGRDVLAYTDHIDKTLMSLGIASSYLKDDVHGMSQEDRARYAAKTTECMLELSKLA